MDEWHVGDPADWGDSVGVPDIPYMGYLQDDEDEDPPQISKSDSIRNAAWNLRCEGRFGEALEKINEALNTHPTGNASTLRQSYLMICGIMMSQFAFMIWRFLIPPHSL